MTKYFAWFGQPGSFVLTVLLSLLALGMAVIHRTPARWLCFAAMLCSSFGDIILMNYRGIAGRLPIPRFYAGACCFMLAHLLYIGAVALLLRRTGGRAVTPGLWLGLAVAAAAGAWVIALTLRRPGVNPVTFAVCVAYLCVIAGMLMAVFSYAWTARGLRIAAALGALSFFLSDVIIGLDTLAGVTRYNAGIWWLYPIGQLLMLLFL